MADLVAGFSVVYSSAAARHSRLARRASASYEHFDRRGLYLVTLTYRPGVEPRQSDITDARKLYLSRFKAAHPSSPVPRILWVRELTRAGNLHYHLVISSDFSPGFWDDSGIWPHGMTRCDTCTRDGRNVVAGYLLKYATKVDTKTMGGVWKSWRAYGFSGFSMSVKRSISYALLPYWARCAFVESDFLSVAKRTLVTGYRLCSGWSALAARVFEGRALDRTEVVMSWQGYCPVGYGHLAFQRLHPGVAV